jgi:CheY-like chemotaxis protein
MAPDTKRVLIVDDHDDGREALRLVLEFSGYRVRDTADPTAAIQIVRSWHPHVVALDLMLPTVTGYAIATQIIAEFGEQRPQLIAITGLASDAHRQKAEEVGFDGFVLKPYEIDALLQLISEGCRRAPAEALTHALGGGRNRA